MKDFSDVFKQSPTTFNNYPNGVNLDEFLNLTEDLEIGFQQYQ